MYEQVPLCAINPSTGQPKNCYTATGFADCPRTGFGVDLLLNSAKNRTDLPNEADVRPMTIAKVAKFKRRKKWKWNQSCDKLV